MSFNLFPGYLIALRVPLYDNAVSTVTPVEPQPTATDMNREGFSLDLFLEMHRVYDVDQVFLVTHKKISVPNAGLNPLRPDSGCPLRAGTRHGRPGRAPGRCGLGGVVLLFILGSSLGGVGPVRGLRGGGRGGWCEEWARSG